MPFGIGNYGINLPSIIKSRDGQSATGLWLLGKVGRGQYKTLLFDAEADSKLLWLRYQLLPKYALLGSYLTSAEKRSTAFGIQYKDYPFKLSVEYSQVETLGEPKQLLVRGEYELASDWNPCGVRSEIYKNANNNPKKHEETIFGTKYTIAEGLAWET